MEEADRERQQIRSDLQSHEDICAERYKAIETGYNEVKQQLSIINNRLGTISDAQVASAAAAIAVAEARASQAKPSKWDAWLRWAIGGTCGGIFALIVGLTVTIFHLEQDKLDAALKREAPGTSVTVSPAQEQPTPVTVPAPVVTAPASPPGDDLTGQ